MAPVSVRLEQLVLGNKKSLRVRHMSRDNLIDKLSSLVMKRFPGCWTKGEFLNYEDCLVYDLHVSGIDSVESSIRVVDFGDSFKVVRIQ